MEYGMSNLRIAILLHTGNEERGVLKVGSIPVAILSSGKYMEIIAL